MSYFDLNKALPKLAADDSIQAAKSAEQSEAQRFAKLFPTAHQELTELLGDIGWGYTGTIALSLRYPSWRKPAKDIDIIVNNEATLALLKKRLARYVINNKSIAEQLVQHNQSAIALPCGINVDIFVDNCELSAIEDMATGERYLVVSEPAKIIEAKLQYIDNYQKRLAKATAKPSAHRHISSKLIVSMHKHIDDVWQFIQLQQLL